MYWYWIILFEYDFKKTQTQTQTTNSCMSEYFFFLPWKIIELKISLQIWSVTCSCLDEATPDDFMDL